MKKLLLILTIIAFSCSLVLATNKVHAVDIVSPDICKGDAKNSPACSNSNDNVISGTNGIILKVTNIIAWVGGVAAVIIIIIAGFRFITSAGNSETVASAKNAIIYAVIGLVVIVLAQAIVIFVVRKL